MGTRRDCKRRRGVLTNNEAPKGIFLHYRKSAVPQGKFIGLQSIQGLYKTDTRHITVCIENRERDVNRIMKER